MGNKKGRPTDYTQEVADIVCEKISMGMSMVKACDDDAMPAPRTIYRWLREHDAFRQNYTFAKEDQADRLADEVVDIADDGTNDFVMESGNEEAILAYKTNGEAINRSRLRVDARKWKASKYCPKKYSEKQQVEQTNVDLTHEQWLESLK